jgi:hypothetical protein
MEMSIIEVDAEEEEDAIRQVEETRKISAKLTAPFRLKSLLCRIVC